MKKWVGSVVSGCRGSGGEGGGEGGGAITLVIIYFIIIICLYSNLYLSVLLLALKKDQIFK